MSTSRIGDQQTSTQILHMHARMRTRTRTLASEALERSTESGNARREFFVTRDSDTAINVWGFDANV